MKTSFDKKYYLISMCLVSLLASTTFLTALHTPIFQQQPPNPTRGPEIDKLRFQVIKDVTPPPNETLYVDEFTADIVDWTVYGDSPYLDAIEDGNYIEATYDSAMIAWFGFENITLDGAEIKKVVLEGYTNGPYNEAVDYDIYANDYSWLGSLYGTGAWAWMTPRWIDETVDEIYPAVLTEEGINSLQVLVYFYDPDEYGGAGNLIDCLRLKVWYQEWPSALDTQVASMQDRTIDVLTELVRPSDIDKLDSECFTITSTPGFHICHFGFNIRPDQSYRGRPELGPFLSDVNFRHALIHLYNQEEIIASLYGYTATPIRSLVPPAQGEWHNPAVPAHPFNPDTAIDILESAGYYYDSGIDNWRNATGYPVPEIRIFSPTYEAVPTSAEHVERFVEDCNDIGLTKITACPTEFSTYMEKVFAEADFDAYMTCWSLERFPDQVHSMCHSSQDSQLYPWKYNAPGISDPELDSLIETVMYSPDHEAQVAACHEIQERLYDESYSYAFAYINMYSRASANAFNPGLRGIVNSPGFGSDNMWTFLNVHWEQGHPDERIENGNSTVIWCLAEEPELLNPTYAHTVYAWTIMNRILDPLIAINPYTLEDLPWIATGWDVEGPITETVTLDSENRYLGVPAGGTVDIVDGMKVTFNLRTDVYWHNGDLYVPEDAEFNLEFLRNNQIPRYTSMWQHVVDVQVINSTAFTVYSDVTSQLLHYDFAEAAALLPPPVWTPLDGETLDTILGYDPSTATGPQPNPDLPWYCPTQLYGTGPFIFVNYDPIAMYTDMPANRNYFKTTEEIHDQLVEMFWACGDVDRNGVVDQTDYDSVEARYGCVIGEPCYDPDCDLNSDGIIDWDDLAIVGAFMDMRREYPAEIVDVAILDVEAFPTVVLPGQQVNITVTAKNKGNAGFTTNFTYYYNDTLIDNQTVTNLIPCHNTTIQYVWDTTGVSPGVYKISVNATVLDGVDVNLTDNTFIDGIVKIGTTKISVDPEKSIVGSAGKNFSINIIITDAPYNTTWAWEFKLSWNASLLNITDNSEGTFLNQGGLWTTTFVNLTDQDAGWVLASCTLVDDPIEHGQPLPYGNETLATINFTVLDLGNCSLHLSDTILLDYNIDPYTHTTQDGEFQVLLGDVDGNGVVDDEDIEIITLAYGSTPGAANWNPEADIWGPNDEPDGFINIYDLAMCSRKYGETA